MIGIEPPRNPGRFSADNHRAWETFEQWNKPFICCFSDGDPITRGLDREFHSRVPGTRGQPHVTLHGGHFLQEDDHMRFAELIIDACDRAKLMGHTTAPQKAMA